MIWQLNPAHTLGQQIKQRQQHQEVENTKAILDVYPCMEWSSGWIRMEDSSLLHSWWVAHLFLEGKQKVNIKIWQLQTLFLVAVKEN